MSSLETMRNHFVSHAGLIAGVMDDDKLMAQAGSAVEKMVECLKRRHKILVCGNGGSAADAQHFSAELMGRFKTERKGLPCIALTTDTSMLTAWSNDYDFDTIFARQVKALGKRGDMLLCISTTGNSQNVMDAATAAFETNMGTIGLLGGDGGKLAGMVDVPIVIEHVDTARVQEVHQIIYHAWCAEIDAAFTS
jgi:D-sedoheptulose 7-phosphate isomerase